MKEKNQTKFYLLVVLAIICVCSCSVQSLAQEEEKNIQAEELIKARPQSKTTQRLDRKNNVVKRNKPKRLSYRVVRYRRTKQTNETSRLSQQNTEEALLGLTVWKIRSAKKNEAAKELIEETPGSNQNSEVTLERMESETPLAVGERIRLSVENLSHNGYLYVIERELYDDGSYSNPKLIYPTLRTKNFNKLITAGNLVFVPEPPRYFRVTESQSGKKQIAEALTIIISPTILVEQSMLQMKAIELPIETFNEWVDKWQVDETLMEQNDGAGQTITLVEQSVGKESAKGLTEESPTLTQDDAIPQSIFKGRIKRGNPLLVNVLIKFKMTQ